MPIVHYLQKAYTINEEQKELALLLDNYGWNPSTILSAIAVIQHPKDDDLPAPGEVIQAIDIARIGGWQITKISKAVLVPEADIVSWLLWREDALSKAANGAKEGKITLDEHALIALHLQGLTFDQLSKLKVKDVDLKNMKVRIPRGGGKGEAPFAIEG